MTESLPDEPRAESAQAQASAATAGEDYTERLRRLQLRRWKSCALVQMPFRLHLRVLALGRCLDIGCGVGRLLRHLEPGSVGIDHNFASVAVCRERGLAAFTGDEFARTHPQRGQFDSLLLAHVLEHTGTEEGDELIRSYLPQLRPGGKVVVFTPQEVGQRSDPTHVRWVDHGVVEEHARRLGLRVTRRYSFPFPRPVGNLFIYNEFVTVMQFDDRLRGDAGNGRG